jgi:integrase
MKGLFRRGGVWWIRYTVHRKQVRESSKSKSKTVAKRLLDRRLGEIAEGREPGVQFDRVRFEDLVELARDDYKTNGRKTLRRVNSSISHLSKVFSGMPAPKITTTLIRKYSADRLEEEAAPGTINRELSTLKRMFKLGLIDGKVDRAPYVSLLKENNTRKGFFEHDEFLAVRNELPDHLKGFVTFGYTVGWRISEIAKLTWGQVDLKQGIVRLEPGETKTDEGRTVYLDEELLGMFRDLWNQRSRAKTVQPYVFLNQWGTGRVNRFDKAWKKACKAAGIEPKLFHDFRRTAIRNMVRANIPERVAMTVSGHKTRSIFERYNIVSDADLQMAAQKQQAYLRSLSSTNLAHPKKEGVSQPGQPLDFTGGGTRV